jgi:hypothetical protein
MYFKLLFRHLLKLIPTLFGEAVSISEVLLHVMRQGNVQKW